MSKADFQASEVTAKSRIALIIRIYKSVEWMVAVALILRMIVALIFIEDWLTPERDHFRFGWETGRIARSVALGEGFSSPLYGPTGPTAWMTPVYVYLLAAVFKMFGIYTFKSAVTILGLNGLFSALTCLTTFSIADKTFGRAIALRAGWAWALFPYAIHFSACRIWDFSLNTLLFSLLFLVALRLEDASSLRAWLGYGLLAGITILACPPALLAALPITVRICYRKWRRGKTWGLSAGLAALMVSLVISPWFARNYLTFNRFIPFRSCFWLVMRSGNTGDLSDIVPDWTHPATSKTEMEEYRRLGEIDYMAAKRRQTLDYISAYPDAFVSLTIRRFFCVWMGYWSLQLFMADLEYKFHAAITTIITTFMLIGLFKAWRSDRASVMPHLIAILSFPLVYYLAHPHAEYRHPIDPIILGLAIYGASALLQRRTRKQGAAPTTADAPSQGESIGY